MTRRIDAAGQLPWAVAIPIALAVSLSLGLIWALSKTHQVAILVCPIEGHDKLCNPTGEL